MAEVTTPPNTVYIVLGLTYVLLYSINFTGSSVRHAGISFIPNKGKTCERVKNNYVHIGKKNKQIYVL